MNRLKYLRTERGENLEKVAEYLNVSIQTISNYENEKRDMTPDTIIKLAEYFDVSTDYLLGKSDIRNPQNTEQDILNEALIGMSREEYDKLTEEQKERIRKFIRFTIEEDKKEN